MEAVLAGTLAGVSARPGRHTIHRLARRATGDAEQRVDAQVRFERALAEASRRRDAIEQELRLSRWGRLL